MIYLLSTQSLLDLLTGQPEMENWMEGKQARSVEISSVSIGQVLRQIHAETNVAERKELESAFEKLLMALRAYQGVIPFDEAASRTWATLCSMALMHDRSVELSSESRMVVATALTRNATFVDADRPYHAALPSLNVENP
jgi:predicted nucleic acid-binding protein